MRERVQSHVGARSKVILAAHTYDDHGTPLDNLDERPLSRGRYIFARDYDPTVGLTCPYRSAPVSRPTWLEIATMADESIHRVGDYHNVFLRGIALYGSWNGDHVRTAKLLMGR